MTHEEYLKALEEEKEDYTATLPAAVYGASPIREYTGQEQKKPNIFKVIPAAVQTFNSLHNIAVKAVELAEYDVDPNYDKDKDFEVYSKELPLEYAEAVRRDARSEDHAMFLVEKAQDEMEAQQVLFSYGAGVGMTAAVAASVFDIDTIFGAGLGAVSAARKARALTTAETLRKTRKAYAAGQKAMDYAVKHGANADEITEVRKYMDDLILSSTTPKSVRNISTVEKYARMAGGAGLASAVTEGALSEAQVTYDDDMLPTAVMAGAIFAPAVVGSISAAGKAKNAMHKVAASKELLLNNINEALPNMSPDRYGVYESDMPYPVFKDLGMDAAQQEKVGTDIDGFLAKVDAAPAPTNLVGTWVEKLGDALQRTPIAGSFYKIKNSTSNTARALAHALLEDPQGRNVGQSAAMRAELYYRRTEGGFSVEYDTAYKSWAKERGMNALDIAAGANKSAFDKDVALELNRRWHGYPDVEINPHVKAAADASSNLAHRALQVGRGREGELSIDGYEAITDNAGYFPLKHTKVRDAVIAHGKDAVIDLYTKGYIAADIKEDIAGDIAKATVRRAVAKSEDIDMSTIGMLDQQDAREFLKNMLIDGGLSESRADDIIDGLRVPLEERGKLSAARRRVPIDLSVTIDTDAGALSMLDMIDTDLSTLYQKYSRTISGQAALARIGLRNKMQQRALVNRILAEQLENPSRNILSREDIEDVLAHFNGTPVAGAPGEAQRFIQGITRLALLGKLGFTQLGELGVVIGSNLLHNFSPSLKGIQGAFKRVSTGAGTADDKALCDEFVSIFGRVGADHDIFKGDLSLELIHKDAAVHNKYTVLAQNLLKRGERLQGFTSLFYAVQGVSQRIAIEGGLQKIFRGVKDNSLSDARMYSIGLKDNHVRYIKQLIEDGVIEYEGGIVKRLNTDKWDEAFKDDFGTILLRHQHQVVQKAMAGESSLWMSKSMGSFLTQLQTYTITSLSKQFVRNMRIADSEALAIAIMSTITAGTAYSAKMALSGDLEEKDWHDIAKGAISYGAYTGWIPPTHDSVMTLIGMDDFKFNTFGTRGNGEIIKPPALSVMNGLAHIPAATVHLLTGEMSKADANNLQTFPILGRAYMMDRIIDSQVIEEEEEY